MLKPNSFSFGIKAILAIGLFLTILVHSENASSGISYHGRIIKPDGKPLSGSNVQFKIQIRSPGLENCLLYEEEQTQDLSSSSGAFALTINDPSTTPNFNSASNLTGVFSNTKTFTASYQTAVPCTYTPQSGDARKLLVSFKDETMANWEFMGTQNLNSVPYALQAQQIDGFSAGSLLRLENGTTETAPLSQNQYDELMNLILGTSALYAKSTQLGGANLPALNSLTSGQSIRWNGSSWEAFTPESGGTSGGITSLTAGTGLSTSTSGAITSTGSIGIADGGVGALQLADGAVTTSKLETLSSLTAGSYGSASMVPIFSVDAKGRITTVSNTSITGLLPSGLTGQFLKSDGTNWAGTSIGLTDLKNSTGASLFTASSCSADETLSWSSLTDQFVCNAIGSLNASAITSGTIDPARLPATASSWDLSGGNAYRMTGNVGIGTNSPTQALDVEGKIASYGMVMLYNASSQSFTGSSFFGNGGSSLDKSSGVDGNFNTGVGIGALFGITRGSENTAVGNNAMRSNTSGSVNTAVGANALYSNTDGMSNVAIGRDTLRANTTGMMNTAVGDSALRWNTASTNSAFGINALYLNSTGSANVGLGASTLYSNTTGGSNTAVGNGALQFNTTANSNTGVGTNALNANTTGTENIAIGNDAGMLIADGSTSNAVTNSSVYLGVGTKALASGQSNQIVIGYGAIGIGSNSVVLGNDSIATTALKGNVGIGTTAPQQKLDVSGTIRSTKMEVGSGNTASGSYSIAAGQNSVASANYAVAMGQESQATGIGAVAIGYGNQSVGRYALATGFISYADGWYSTATGYGTLAEGQTSTALGMGTWAGTFAETAVGSYNSIISGNKTSWVSSDPLFVIGNGANVGARSNAMTVLKNGNVGIGTTAPTSTLHLKAGSSTANSAPMKFTAGSNLATPEAGAVEYDGTNLYFTDSAGTRKTLAVAGAGGASLSGLTAATVSNTIANSNYTQTWNWDGLSTGNGFMIGSNSLTTGNVMSLAGTNNSASSTGNVFKVTSSGASSNAVPLMVTNEGTGASFRVNDDGSDTDSSPFLVDAAGKVGIGTTSLWEMALSVGNGTNSDGGFVAKGFGTVGTDGTTLTTSGAGTRMIWYPKKAAFRVGNVSGTQWNNSAIGNYSFAAGKDSIASGEASVALGEGVASGLSSFATGWVATASGENAVAMGVATSASGTASTAIGATTNASGDYSVAMGYNTTASSASQLTFGQFNVALSGNPNGWVSTDPLFVIGNGTATASRSNAVTVLKNGNFGIGTTAPTYQLQLSTDSAAKPGTSTWTIASDQRLKTIRAPFTRGLDAINGLHVIYFTYKESNPLGLPSEKEFVGIKAQDVQKVIPEAVSQDDQGYLHVTNDSIIWTAVNSIKELYSKVLGHEGKLALHEREIASVKTDKVSIEAKIQKLEERNRQLEKENTMMKSRLDKIERMLNAK